MKRTTEKRFTYALTFLYRETKNSEYKTERFIVNSTDPDGLNACEIAMLQYLTKHNYYSGKVEKYTVLL